jgi:branched-chain amino acid transport system permease protein
MLNRLKLQNWIFLGLGALLLLFGILPPLLPPYIVLLLTLSLIYAIAAMSLNLLLGYTGLPAVGHSAFLAIGAYTTGSMITRYGCGFGTSLVFSIGLVVAAAAVVAPLALRAIGLYFLIITLSIALCVWGIAMRWVSMTDGENGLGGIPRPDLGLPWNMEEIVPFYYLILIFFIIFFIFIILFLRSPFGKTLVAIRDNESRMSVLGYNVWIHKYIAFLISAAFEGFAGILFVYYNGSITPTSTDLESCMKLVLMVALGGPGTLAGPILGAFIITFLENIVSIYTERWLMVMAVIYIVTAKYTPRGLLPLLNDFFRSEDTESEK